MADTHYRPILLTRQGERQALQDLSEEDHTKFTPVFVIPPIPWDFEMEAPSKTLGQYLEKLPAELAKARKASPAFIDLVFLTEAENDLVEGQHALTWLHEACALEGLELIPIVSTNSAEKLLQAARRIIEAQACGVALRLQVSEWPFP